MRDKLCTKPGCENLLDDLDRLISKLIAYRNQCF
jgi:hypothetical protein